MSIHLASHRDHCNFLLQQRKHMTKFRPCIDLHDGKVKQIVGATLTENEQDLKENFISEQSPADFSLLYKKHDLTGGHVIQLGAGNKEAAFAALAAWEGGMQLGGGVCIENAAEWLDAGASHVIVTSWLFSQNGEFLTARLRELEKEVGREKIVIDLSCRRVGRGWTVAMNRWQTLTDLSISGEVLDRLSEYCDEYLIHAADVEGLCSGVDLELVELLGSWGKLPITYAGGASSIDDVKETNQRSGGKVDITVGSALDLFGGSGLTLDELIAWNQYE